MRSGQHNDFWRTNEQIRASELRVIGSDGKQVGILSREEALTRAREAGIDLVEIAPHANPPVAKLIDFTKFKYEQEKKKREERKKEKKGTTLKEVWFTPLIAEGDYQTRFAKVKEFLEDGAKVRVTIKPKRRLDNTNPLYRLLGRIVADVAEIARVEQEPRMFGRQLVTLLTPYKGSPKEETEKQEREKTNGKKEENKAQAEEVSSSEI